MLMTITRMIENTITSTVTPCSAGNADARARTPADTLTDTVRT